MNSRWVIPRPGILIAVCGLDGSGKTTQIRLLEQNISRQRTVFCTRPVGDLFRQDSTLLHFLNERHAADEAAMLVPELTLLSATDRLRHMRSVIMPRLVQGDVVLCDRYVYSSYAWMIARGLDDVEWISALNRYLPQPDLTIYLDITPETSAVRIESRGDLLRWEEADVERMSRVRRAYLDQPWGQHPDYHIMDAERSPDEVNADIVRLVQPLLDRYSMDGPARSWIQTSHQRRGDLYQTG